MNHARIQQEVRHASATFALVEAYPTTDGGVCVKAGLQTSAGRQYVVTVYFPEYPNRMPKVFVTAPRLRTDAPHVYREGNLCYMHPNFWNPGNHDLVFVIKQVAVWLNKYEVWRDTGRWPGQQLMH